MTILEIAKACNGKLFCCDETKQNTEVTHYTLDSRKVEEGGAFFATIGERVDGHSFISQVFDKGAAVVITSKTPEQVSAEKQMDCSGWGTYILVEDTLQALKEIAEAHRQKLNIPIVGIAGSVGKTSTKEFVAGTLSAKLKVLKTEGNFNNEIGVPLTLLRITPEYEIAVVEMGISDFGEMHRLSKMVRPNVCLLTNIGQCHLENLKDRDGILCAKSEIFDYMAEDGEICLNGEDDKLITLQKVKGHTPHFFGFGDNKDEAVWADSIESHGLFGSEATIHVRGKEGVTDIRVNVPLPGRHMVLNAAAAACVASLFGLTPEEIASGIESVTPVSGRNNLMRLEKLTLIDDCYNANPASMRAALDLLAMADTEKVAILGDMFELGDNADLLHAGVGEYAAKLGIDRIYCIGEKAAYMYEAATENAGQSMHIAHFADKESFIACVKAEKEDYVPSGATVLLKASHGMQFGIILEFLKELA